MASLCKSNFMPPTSTILAAVWLSVNHLTSEPSMIQKWRKRLYNVTNKTRGSNTLPKFEVSTKISVEVDTRRNSIYFKRKQFAIAMYLRDISNLLIKNIPALNRVECRLRDKSVGAVWVSWGECGSAISASWAIPGDSAFSCPVAEFVTFKAPGAVHVSISTAWKQMK